MHIFVNKRNIERISVVPFKAVPSMQLNGKSLNERTAELVAKDLKTSRKSSEAKKEFMKRVMETAKRLKKK